MGRKQFKYVCLFSLFKLEFHSCYRVLYGYGIFHLIFYKVWIVIFVWIRMENMDVKILRFDKRWICCVIHSYA